MTDEPVFSEEYVSPTGTAPDGKGEEQRASVVQTVEEIAAIEKYGTGKPRRKLIRADLKHD